MVGRRDPAGTRKAPHFRFASLRTAEGIAFAAGVVAFGAFCQGPPRCAEQQGGNNKQDFHVRLQNDGGVQTDSFLT